MAHSFWKKWWWVGVVCLTSGVFYIHARNEKCAAIEGLSFRLQEMEKEKVMAIQEQEDLKLQIASQNDPGWIEMVLMRDLGLVPEGWLKVHFKKQ